MPCRVEYTADDIFRSKSETLLATHTTLLPERSWNRQTPQEMIDISEQENEILRAQAACYTSPSGKTGICTQNSRRDTKSPTSITMLYDSDRTLQAIPQLLEERNDPAYEGSNEAELLSIILFKFNQEQGKWEQLTRKVKSHASIDAHLAEQGQQGHYSSKVEVIEFHDTNIFSKESGKRYVIKYPNPPEDLVGEEVGECDMLPLAGEIWAYELSEALKLNLVPKTQLVIIQDKRKGLNYTSFATMKPYIEDLKKREQLSCKAILQKKRGLLPEDITQREYEELVSNNIDNKDVQAIKLFSFITGQWDQRQGNVLIRNTGSPLVVDNEHIFAPYIAAKRAKTYEELKQKKTFIRLGKSVHIRRLGAQDEPMILHGSVHRVKLAMWTLLHGDVPGCKEYQLSSEEKKLLKGHDKELVEKFELVANSHKRTWEGLNKLKIAYLGDLQREGEIVDWKTWQEEIQSKVQLAKNTQTIIFYIDNYQVYRHYPTEMLLYMTKCDLEVLCKFAHENFQKSVLCAGQNTVNKITMLCNWMQKNGLEFYEGFLPNGYDERSDGYIPNSAKNYPMRFICEVANIAEHLVDETTKRRDSAVRYLIRKSDEETEDLIDKLHTLKQIDQEVSLDCFLASDAHP